MAGEHRFDEYYGKMAVESTGVEGTALFVRVYVVFGDVSLRLLCRHIRGNFSHVGHLLSHAARYGFC